MKLKKIALRNFLIVIAVAFSFVACDKDFATVDSDIINEDTATNFNTTSEKYDVISYTNRLEPIQTNGLGLYQLGYFKDDTYGETTSSILTQVSSSLIDPTFGPDQTPGDVTLDSVVMTIPFFSRNTGISDENTLGYELDSVFSSTDDLASIKLSIYENNYFLRNFNPNDDFDSPQAYFSDRSISNSEQIGTADLEFQLIDVIDELKISDKEIILTDGAETDPIITERLSPRIRKVWNKDIAADADVINYWNTKILAQEGQTTLSNANNFNDYFRGLYFKAETFNGNGSLLLLNLEQTDANIVLHYSFESATVEDEIDNATYTLTFGANRVNFLENNFNILSPTDGDEVNGDDRIFLKGGEGAVANIKLFNGENADDDDTTDNTFEAWRKQFVILDEDGEFESSRRLVNEANLVLYVDQDQVNGKEPERLYLYNGLLNGALLDYFEDTQNNSLPQISIPTHLGILERDDSGKGLRYKMRITTHINNILINGAENVELGLAVSGNVNLESTVPQYQELTSGSESNTIPVSTIITPRGTVLHGNNSSVAGKKLELEIFYTCLETDMDCPNN